MNCIEVRTLVEDMLDNSLAGRRKRAFKLHLSRCDACRKFMSAECDEHRRWFQAMNESTSLRRLPDGFAEEFTASVRRRHTLPQGRWRFFASFRRIAAVLLAALLLAGISYAAVVAANAAFKTETGEQDMKIEEKTVAALAATGSSSSDELRTGDLGLHDPARAQHVARAAAFDAPAYSTPGLLILAVQSAKICT